MNQTINDKLKALGYTGTLDDKLKAYYAASGGSGANSVADAKRKSLGSLGYSAGTIVDAENNKLNAAGRSGTISDKRKKDWT